MKLRKMPSLLLSGVLFMTAPSIVNAQQTPTNNCQWKFKTSTPFFASPLVENNRIYIGGLDSVFYCLNLTNGEIVWTIKTGGPIRSTAKSSGEFICFFSGDGSMYSLSKNNGAVNWKFASVDKMADPFDYYQSSPLIHGDTLYFGSGDGNVYSINVHSGKLNWKFATGNVVHSTPAHFNSKIYVNSFDGNTYALNAADGQLIWKFKSIGHRYFPNGEMQFSPVVANGLVFTSGRDYNLYALDAEKGYAHWNRVFPRGWAPVITPSPANDSVVYIGTSDDYLVLCLNSINGRELWKANVKFNVFGACSFRGDTGYASTLMGKCFSFNRKTGELLEQFTSDSYREHRLEYFKPDDTFRDDIFSILHSNEDLIEAEYKVGGFYSTPVITGEYLLLSSTDGTLYCYSLRK